jgi:hypothetical protein
VPGGINVRVLPVAAGLAFLVVLAAFAGCTSSTATPSYSVDSNGVLSVTCAPVTTSETVLFANETYTVEKLVLRTTTGDVVTYLSYPKTPKAAIVYIPGAGEKITGHEERMVRYAAAGYAFMFVDTRGRGGETAGSAFSPQADYAKFKAGNQDDWPGFYLTICDISSARTVLATKFGVPVYAVGGSNGGRYAAVAAGVDRNFAGYVGISTSDWGVKDAFTQQGYTGDPVRFASSLEPGTYIGKISPRPVWLFHAKNDPVIPFENGQQLFNEAGEPKTFTEFSGSHGINSDVDEKILRQWAQIYAPRG